MHILKSQLKNFFTLKKRADFLNTGKSGSKWVAKGLIIQAASADHDAVRVGYTVSKKIYKSAVKRNRIKRRLRAVAADVLSQEALPSHDYVIIGRKETLERSYESLCADLRWCLKRLGKNCEKP